MASTHPVQLAVVDGIAVDKPTFRDYMEERTPLILTNGNEIQGLELPNTTVVIVGAAAYGYDPLDTTSAHNGTSVLVDATTVGRRYKPGGIAADAVTNAMLADMPLYSIKANVTAGAANPTDAVRASFTAVTAATTHRAIGFLSTGELRAFDLGNLAGLNTVPTASIDNDAVTYAKIQNISVTQRVLGRNTGGAGDTEEVTATQVLDWIGATRGQVLFRGTAAWTALATGTAGFFLRTAGAGADPTWAAPLATEITNTPAGNIAAVTVQAAINELDTEKAGLALANIFTNSTQTIQSTDAGATVAPILNLDRFSASPLAADILGSIEYHGRSSTAVDRIYASTKALITSPTNAAEAGIWNVATIQAGAVADRFRVGLGFYYAAGTDQGASTVNALNLFVAGANITTLYQPLDADLTSIAALTTTSFGRSFLDRADAAAARTLIDADQLGTISGQQTQTGTTYTAVAGDRGKAITMNNAGANTLTFPANASVAFPINTVIYIIQLGAGQTTIVLTTDTLRTSGGKSKLVGQYSAATMIKIAATEWVLFGDLTT